jgi:diaminopimelate epimerase
MRLPFTKMHGAGNDFVVLDATRAPIELSAQQVQRLGDRRFGVGADQVLVVERTDTPGVDFRYRIFNGFSGTRWSIAATVRAASCATCATRA